MRTRHGRMSPAFLFDISLEVLTAVSHEKRNNRYKIWKGRNAQLLLHRKKKSY